MSKKNKNEHEEVVDTGREINEEVESPEQIEDEVKAEHLDELSTLKLEVEKLKDALARKAAEFENFKRRRSEEMTDFYKYASEAVIKKIIPVYDDISRSVDSINKGETKDFETLKKGVELIYDKFKKALEEEGVTEINSLGKEFDVDVNEALLQVPKNDVPPNTVVEVIEKGYKLKDKVIKHEKVLVSKQD